MRIRSGYTNGHITITVDGDESRVYCGASWCNGECGHPALVTRAADRVLRAFGSQVACGPVFQPFRGPWTGEMVTAGGDPEQLAKKIWL